MKKRLTVLLICLLIILSGCGADYDQITWLSSPHLSEEERNNSEKALLGVGSTPVSMLPLSSAQIAQNMRVCWNLGNSLDACKSDLDLDGKIDTLPQHGKGFDETLYGNPTVSLDLFKALADSGVNAVRIPITWRSHTDTDGNIEEEWLNRVQQVVDIAYNRGMYVIINVQHDGAQDTRMGAWIRRAQEDESATVVMRYRTLWTQIAKRFENYSERLIFESMNEVCFDSLDENKAYRLYSQLNQEFVNVIRQGGGNNPERHIIIAGYNADIEQTLDSRFVMPDDPAGKSMVSVHYRTPRAFCVTGDKAEWGSEEEIQEMDGLLARLKERFTDNGIPVVITEYGFSENADEDSANYFCERLVYSCTQMGMAAFIWDDGSLFDRKNLDWRSPALIAAINRAASGEEYDPQKGEETTEEQTCTDTNE